MSRTKKRKPAKQKRPRVKIAGKPDQPLLGNRSTVLPGEDRSTSANETHIKHRYQGRYVYGVVEAREPIDFSNVGIGGTGRAVYAIHYRGLAALVSETPVFIIDLTRENLLAHEQVVESVMRRRTIIPMSFGTVFRTDDDVRELLKSVYLPLKESLGQLDGKVEFGLKVMWDRDRVMEDLKRENHQIRHVQQELAQKRLHSTHLTRRHLGRLIDDAISRHLADAIHEIYEALRSACVASRDNKPIGEKMLMNAAFLIERQQESTFEEAVTRIASKFGDRLIFKCTGPWAPYNFVSIRLRVEPGAGG